MARTSGSKGTASNARGAREILLDTAERLLAEHGIDGVSMRQIAAAAGQGNNSVIQYHFGDKAGLLREIILRRVAGFEPRRRRCQNPFGLGRKYAKPDQSRRTTTI